MSRVVGIKIGTLTTDSQRQNLFDFLKYTLGQSDEIAMNIANVGEGVCVYGLDLDLTNVSGFPYSTISYSPGMVLVISLLSQRLEIGLTLGGVYTLFNIAPTNYFLLPARTEVFPQLKKYVDEGLIHYFSDFGTSVDGWVVCAGDWNDTLPWSDMGTWKDNP